MGKKVTDFEILKEKLSHCSRKTNDLNENSSSVWALVKITVRNKIFVINLRIMHDYFVKRSIINIHNIL